VFDGRYSVQHGEINLQDKDYYNPGARIKIPSKTVQYRLRKEIESDPENHLWED
jgi:hypothetical protein